jgi:uncharacterized membrane protein (DUF106 family)
MNMFEWFQSLSGDAKSIMIAVIGPIAGAIFGALIKWLLDRKLIKELKDELGRARVERQDAVKQHKKALDERSRALDDLADREVDNRDKQRQLDTQQRKLEEVKRLLNDRKIDIDARRDKLNKLLEILQGNETGLWTTHKE